ncbi:single-stranded-DNA-specific exonuclease RecJ [Microcoleus sp. FACHB-1515]|uniref:single-stranded-DNA-specific exonuclease RecJ n=1 Tax=Cyanophyceae TaxID=3028117 RepID=UPI001684345C|nr:single-stranded-DNA-specific exonuclease RecJ [Microcoleus sp. FACHB-1515]MBD2092055.1 single-stranded-DNA-specific exonuclease RecJ [Microcoleus sp. FACHB-1515]
MREPSVQWQVAPAIDLSAEFVAAVRTYLPDAEAQGQFAATLLWQRGWRDLDELAGFLDANRYQPTSPFAFGEEMQRAIDRLLAACDRNEFVAIWGDFDADGITATAVLWEGLGQFFPSDRLTYTIPNRLHESHGLSIAGLDRLAAQGVSLVITCDTGSTNPAELEYAQAIGLDVIITDHHTLPAERPPVTAILNPRYLPADHPLAHLSGVAVAYKLVEALYETRPNRVDRAALPERYRPLTDLLDLVAIGLIADLVQLRGDCRYLAQQGLVQLQQQCNPLKASRPGIARLLELCKRSGDRPTDISFGIGPRINAISRIHGDARFGVELLTSRDRNRCRQLADETELANTRRKALQKDLLQQVQVLLAQIDLSTTSVIVLSDPQWPIGILGLVAGQIAQQYGRPTILLSEEVSPEGEPLARGSARSIGAIDLYELVQDQADLLHSFGGHPLAAGLSLPVANIPLFRSAVNQALRRQNLLAASILTADLTVTIADLGGVLFRELRLLEPYGIGNPPPRLLIRNCWFREVQTEKIQDWKGGKVRYSKISFKICDETGEFFGVWWEHTPADLPQERCDAIAELENNPYQKRYEIRLVAVQSIAPAIATAPDANWLLDWRTERPIDPPAAVLELRECPRSWEEFHQWAHRARQTGRSLALAYSLPSSKSAEDLWQDWLGLAKFLSRTGEAVDRSQLQTKFQFGDSAFTCGLDSLQKIGFGVTIDQDAIAFSLDESIEPDWNAARQAFVAAVREEQFRQQYFCQVDRAILQAALQQIVLQSNYA